MLDNLHLVRFNSFLARFASMKYATGKDLYQVPYIEYKRNTGTQSYLLLLADIPATLTDDVHPHSGIEFYGWNIDEVFPGKFDLHPSTTLKPTNILVWEDDDIRFRYKDYVVEYNVSMTIAEFLDKVEPIKRSAYMEQMIDALD
jgi:hypothetical protein